MRRVEVIDEVQVGLNELINLNLEGFLDLLDELTNEGPHPLMEIDYELLGASPTSGLIAFRVRGYIEEEDEDE